MSCAGWEFITLHSSVHYGGKWGPLSLLFNGPTSRNVAGYIFGCLMCLVILYFGFTLSPVSLDPGRAAPHGGGTTPSQSSQLAREPTGLQRVVVFPDNDPRRATIVRRRLCSWKESSSRSRVVHHTLEWREEGNCFPYRLGIYG